MPVDHSDRGRVLGQQTDGDHRLGGIPGIPGWFSDHWSNDNLSNDDLRRIVRGVYFYFKNIFVTYALEM
jgi:hypothetical protein